MTTRLFIICSTSGRISGLYAPWYRSNTLTAAAQYSPLDVSPMSAAVPSIATPRSWS